MEDEVLGTVITSTTVGDQVSDLEELPFTGPHDGALLFIGGSLLTSVESWFSARGVDQRINNRQVHGEAPGFASRRRS